MLEDMNHLKSVEARLAALAPASPRIDRDNLMYHAGKAAAPRAKVLPWQLATAAFLGISVALALVRPASTPQPTLARNPDSETHMASAPRPAQIFYVLTPDALRSDKPYLTLRDNLLDHGMSALAPSGNTNSSIPQPDANLFIPHAQWRLLFKGDQL